MEISLPWFWEAAIYNINGYNWRAFEMRSLQNSNCVAYFCLLNQKYMGVTLTHPENFIPLDTDQGFEALVHKTSARPCINIEQAGDEDLPVHMQVGEWRPEYGPWRRTVFVRDEYVGMLTHTGNETDVWVFEPEVAPEVGREDTRSKVLETLALGLGVEVAAIRYAISYAARNLPVPGEKAESGTSGGRGGVTRTTERCI